MGLLQAAGDGRQGMYIPVAPMTRKCGIGIDLFV